MYHLVPVYSTSVSGTERFFHCSARNEVEVTSTGKSSNRKERKNIDYRGIFFMETGEVFISNQRIAGFFSEAFKAHGFTNKTQYVVV
jgi:hypothetical protein